ncbi:MAG TPA: DUF1572 family protein [Saprospiraceae bacterium]|nr:DUF1572 family protein [Saprospiraceae bacterium]HQW55573.1 DUF1572 family protein [Saprospiraceae bacterium]
MQGNFLSTALTLFKYYKSLADKAISQLSDEALHWRRNEDSNNIAIIVRHMAGNMLSRWTDFLNSDGEKSWRDRDSEFEDAMTSRAEMMNFWEKGWAQLFETLDSLDESQLNEIIYIRNEGQSVMEAIMRQLAHYSNHTGQIILLAKMLASDWKTLSIAKNKSGEYNEHLFTSEKALKDFTQTAHFDEDQKEK